MIVQGEQLTVAVQRLASAKAVNQVRVGAEVSSHGNEVVLSRRESFISILGVVSSCGDDGSGT